MEIYPDFFPYTVINVLPFWGTGDLAKDAELQRYCYTHPLAAENFARQNLQYGMTGGPVPFYLLLANNVDKVTTVDQLDGLQFRAFGYNGAWAKELGMVPNNLRAFQVYEAFEKGQLHVSPVDFSEGFAMKLYEQCNKLIADPLYVSGGRSQGSLNLDAWNSLPQYMKDLWVEVENDLIAYSVEFNGKTIAAGRKGLADNGVDIYNLSPEELAKFKAPAQVAWDSWISTAMESPNGKDVKKYAADCIAFRDKLTGEPWMFKP
jgi:TRAP-type C4-dicarboxylate transport system substrate-binding protein